MNCRQLWFTRPLEVEIREQLLPPPGPGEVLVRTLCSAISAGTEMLVYHGELPPGLAIDASLESLQRQADSYPLRYGYALAGRIERIGDRIDPLWLGRRVFAFQPHASHFISTPAQLIPLPDSVEPADAVFLANMETAVNLVLDGKPLLGERIVILGQGVVGLLTLSLLSRFPHAGLYAIDRLTGRRARARESGATDVIDPDSGSDINRLKAVLGDSMPGGGADLVYELSGRPEALNLTIDLCGYGSRIITGSWYGTRSAGLNLGGSFHRNRISLISSQVSTIAPDLCGRWDKPRRFATAWHMIETMRPQSLITHRIPFDSAPDAYALLHRHPEQVLQIVFEYPG